jgi:hypothetical protein
MANNIQLTPLEALGIAIKAEIEAARPAGGSVRPPVPGRGVGAAAPIAGPARES